AHRRPRVGRRLAVLLAAASVAVAAALTTGSAAIFTSASGNGLSTVSAGDWVPPTVNLTSPGSSVSGEVTRTAQATDPGGTGVTQVVIQHRPAGSTAWTSTCPTPTAPYGCAWNTTTVSDGVYELRAV